MSRLQEDSERIRELLETRNLYTPNEPYNLFKYDENDNPNSPYFDNRELVKSINSIVGVIKPFSSFDLTNTVLYRLIGPNTPIAQIGLQMLGKQFAATVASNASTNYLPSIKFSNLFDGNPDTKFIMLKKDFQITRRESQTNLGSILEAISGVKDYLNTGNPFTKDADVTEYIKNSGKGQLQILIENINRNVYKIDNSPYINAIEEKGLQIKLGTNILNIKEYFSPINGIFNPFSRYLLINGGLANADQRNDEIKYFNDSNKIGLKEYGNTQTHVDDLGVTFLRDKNGSKEYIFNSENFGLNDNSNEQLVWGRDGATDYYKETLGTLVEGEVNNPRFSSENKFESFNIKTGLLNYTKNLLNAKGEYGSFDLTRKKFLDTNNHLHFNGSPLDTHPDGEIDFSRRHSMADPYDRYAKAIRFNGNKIYGGNPDSVIFNSVIPKFHPTRNGAMVDNRNMMFSIENLAVQVIKDEEAGVGYIKDEMATSLPLCEAGNNGGRLMWFPPYDIKLSEQAIAHWDSTNFIGRGEPVYTYTNSERLANMSFKLLVDYPEQLINYRERGEGDFQKVVSEFFAFGGEGPSPQFDTNLSQKEGILIDKIKEREEVEKTVILVEPNLPSMKDKYIYFPNDYPHSAGGPLDESYIEKTNVWNILFPLGYEDGKVNEKEINGIDYKLNKKFIEEFSNTSTVLMSLFNPNDDTLHNEEGIPYIKILIGGGATVLYNSTRTKIDQETYNKALSRRRQLATREYIEKLFISTFGKSAKELHVEILSPESLAVGSTLAALDNNTAISISEIDAKKERYGTVLFQRNSVMMKKFINTTVEDDKKRKILDEEIAALESEIKNIKRRMASYNPCVFESHTETGGYEKGFSSVFNDKFYPVFHTQTPEDLHRRLTFLQQCVRQGPAIRVLSNGITSSKNSVFGRQPICVLRFGDFFHTKIIIDNISFNYDETTWDLNPEGRGMQPMIVDISIQMKIIGGQSLRTPIDALQNAVSFNYYANSTFTKEGLYSTPARVEEAQINVNNDRSGLSTEDQEWLELVRRRNKSVDDANALPTLQRKSPI